MYKKDRSTNTAGKGGGVLFFVKDTLQSSPLQNLTNDEFQNSVWCRFNSDNHTTKTVRLRLNR